MENELKIWGEIQLYTKVFPKKAKDGQVYVYFQFVSKTHKVPSKRKPEKLVSFRAECYATGSAWALLKAKELYAGRIVYVEGEFDLTLGNNAFRVRVLDYENLNQYLQPEPSAVFHPTHGFTEQKYEF